VFATGLAEMCDLERFPNDDSVKCGSAFAGRDAVLF